VPLSKPLPDASSPRTESEPGRQRLPQWLRVKLPQTPDFAETSAVVARHGLDTVCRGARCPNIFQCFSQGVATFLILGRVCTRGCAFCNISPGSPQPLEPDEPARVAQAVSRLGLKHVVITSVTRDDLPDGGAGRFAAVIRAVRQEAPGCGVEVLVPDFQGRQQDLQTVLEAGPDVLNHNLETVPSLYRAVRPKAVYQASLALISRARAWGQGIKTKSGLMVGLGETREELARVLADLAGAGCHMVTVGQYLRPSRRNLAVARYVHPDEFKEIEALGLSLGVPVMYCGPLVRSSHQAGALLDDLDRAKLSRPLK